jgi:hypothetical protein
MPANQIGKLGVDAFLDSMISHDEINALKSPHTIRIGGVDMAKPEVTRQVCWLGRLMNSMIPTAAEQVF